jgi:serine/threonine-protein kinase
MDWGIAKAFQQDGHGSTSSEPSSAPGQEGGRERLLATRAGAYVGTPSYMAPEQALGKNHELDPRSDLYSATVLLHELVTLRHYLGERPSVEATLAAIVGEEVSVRHLFGERHPHQAPPPAELLYTLAKGLQKDPAKRFQTAGEMIDELQDVLEGRAAIRCEVTFTKRMLREMARFVDRHPGLAVLAMVAVAASVLFTGVSLVQAVLA